MPNNKLVFSNKTLNQLIVDGENEAKLIFQDPDGEINLAYFILVRKAFNDAYERIKKEIAARGKDEIGDNFKGVSGAYVRGSYSPRGGSKYQLLPAAEVEIAGEISELVSKFMAEKHPEIDPNFIEMPISFKINSKNVDAYVKEERELPMFIEEAERHQSMSLTVTKDGIENFENHKHQFGIDAEALPVGEKEGEDA